MVADRSRVNVPGWLETIDELLIEWVLLWQTEVGLRGDLVELGVYEGRSAIHIGRFVAPGERLVVCDLFEDIRSSELVPEGIRRSYSTLTQASFESNYLRFHPTLPTIIRGPSSRVSDYVAEGSCRFVHIDASHLYADVRADISSAQRILSADGLVVFDDYRNEKTIGTAAAVWEAVHSDGLSPVCATAAKLYATWGDPEPLRQHIVARLRGQAAYYADPVPIGDRVVVRVASSKLPPAAYGPPAGAQGESASRTVRLLTAIGLTMSSAGFRLRRLAQSDDPFAAAKNAGLRRLARLQALVAGLLPRRARPGRPS